MPDPINKLFSVLLFLFLTTGVFAKNIYYPVEIPQKEIFLTPDKDTLIKTIYTTDSGLPQNSINSLLQTRDGFIWLATNGGLVKFDGLTFTLYSTTNTPQLVNNGLTSLYEDRHGTLWIGSGDNDLMCYKNGEFFLLRKNTGSSMDAPIRSFYLDQNDILWIGNERGLITYNIHTQEFTVLNEQMNLELSDVFLMVYKIESDSSGKIWIHTNYGLIYFKDGKFKTQIKENEKALIPGIINFKVLGDSIWLQTKDGFKKIQNDLITTKQITELKNSPTIIDPQMRDKLMYTANTIHIINGGEVELHDLSDYVKTKITSALIDNEGNFWIGTDVGLIRLKKRFIKVFAHLDNEKEFFPSMSIIQDKDQTIWISSYYELISYKDGKFNKFKFNDEIVSNLALDTEGNLFVGTELRVFKYVDGRFIQHEIPDSTLRRDYGLFFQRDGRYWVFNKNLGLAKVADNTLVPLKTTEGIVNNFIYKMLEDRNGAIWIGTKGGVSKYENNTFTNYTAENGLFNTYIRDIYEDQDGIIWLGSYGGGISRLKDGKITVIASEKGLAEDIVSRILVDDNDNFWMLGNQSIYSVSRKSLNDLADGKLSRVYCAVYGLSDGMVVSEGNGYQQPAGWKTNDGKLWFPMIKGAVIIDPKKIHQPVISPTYIEEVQLSNKKLNITDKEVIINPGQNNLEIKYTGVNFSNPEQLHFSYKLDGYDKDWQEIGTRRIAYYPYLPAGNYTFQVRTLNEYGVPNESIAELKIRVLAPFWQTIWFYSLLSLAVIFFIIFVYQKRLKKLEKKRLRQLEFSRQIINAHESERTRIAKDLHDSLGQSLLIIRNWSLLALRNLTSNQKTAQTQIEEISQMAASALDDTRAIVRNLEPRFLAKVGLTQTLTQITGQIENSLDIQIESNIENVDNLFSKDESLMIFRIVQEALNNIIKYANATMVNINVFKLNSHVQLIVKDNGQGFNVEEKINSGLGLNNIQQRVEIIGGECQIKSEIGKGTELLITFYNRKDLS